MKKKFPEGEDAKKNFSECDCAKKISHAEDVLTLWEKYQRASCEKFGRTIKKKYETINAATSEQILSDAARFSRVGETSVLEHLQGLMGVYRRIIEFSEAQKFENATVSALVFGICEVLKLRVREFEEHEKKEIFEESLAKISEKISAQKENFSTGVRVEKSENWDDSFEMILRGSLYEIFSLYCEGLRLCQQQVGFFSDLIERETDELSTIVKVQVLALEDAGGGENPAIPSIIDALREAFQQLTPVAEILKKPATKINYRSFEEFEKFLLDALENSSSDSPERKKFFDALDAQTLSRADEISTDYKKAAYNLQRVTGAEILLAEEITRVFEKISLPDLEENSPEREILAGIKETIEIKISGLHESIQIFSKQCGETVKKFFDEKPAVSDDDKKNILDAARSAWLAKQEIPDEIFLLTRERAQRHINLFSEILEKQTMRFKKEILLYEICTYEEILTHSVSRLRDSKNPTVLSAVLALDDTFRALEINLKKNNVAVIRPAVKEMFNAREHEVLVAEKHDGFEKGEIIKIMTAGYKFREQVILRANVIAAK